MKLIIATPFYEVKAYSPYIVSLLSSIRVLNELNMEWDYYELSGDSYVDRAKNALVDRFLNETDSTHIFMIDSDLSWNMEGFIRVIKAGLMGAEIVGGAYPNKNNWSTFGAITIMQDGIPLSREINGLTLYEMWGIPGGFILYSREAFERTRSNLNSYYENSTDKKFVEYFRRLIQDRTDSDDTNYFNHIKYTFDKALKDFGNFHGSRLNEKFLECFCCNVEKYGGRVGEDIYFQQRYREAGGTVWCEPDVSFLHYGVKGWEGNFKEHMKEQEQESTEELIERIKQIKTNIKAV